MATVYDLNDHTPDRRRPTPAKADPNRVLMKLGGLSGLTGQAMTLTETGIESQDLTKKHVALIVRQLVGARFDRTQLLDELKG